MIIAIIVSVIVGAVGGAFALGLCSAGSTNETMSRVHELEEANEQLRALLKDAYKEIAEYEEKTKSE